MPSDIPLIAVRGGQCDTFLQSASKLGILDSDQNRIEAARNEYEEALKIYESFAKQDSIRFSPDVERVKKLLKGLTQVNCTGYAVAARICVAAHFF